MATLLTIAGESQSIRAWSRVPGAAQYHTIYRRWMNGADAVDAVFGPNMRGKAPRVRGLRVKRAPVSAGQLFPVSVLKWGSCQSITWRAA